jgi:4-hydroxy-tetrahydrodipicolinate reductase
MGGRLVGIAHQDPDVEVVAALTVSSDPRVGEQVITGGAGPLLSADTDAAFDVMIDFSLPDGTMQWLPRCVESGSALVSGTTGFSDAQMAAVRAASCRIPILWASNFSVGINLVQKLAATAVGELGPDFDIEIVETHHNRKIDAPSGTAWTLANALADARGRNVESDYVVGRRGEAGPRPKREIGIHAVRLGDEVGRHEVHFGGPGETLVLQHTVRSRDTFARGALLAAKWIADKQPGFYSMQDVLGSGPAT